ncbi:hypothetical protein JW899_03180 [Candidatus Uhrbacteria bacterium]|nr:hypothetical protein [Candidatus Uhrbacteria bacterium]
MTNLGPEGKSGLWRRIKPWHCGLSVGSVTAAVLVAGWFRGDREAADIGLSVTLALATGAAFFALGKARFLAWSAVFSAGWLIGLGSAVEIFAGEGFDRQGFVVLATVLFWLVLSLVIGFLAEFILAVHRLTHRLCGDRPENREKRP